MVAGLKFFWDALPSNLSFYQEKKFTLVVVVSYSRNIQDSFQAQALLSIRDSSGHGGSDSRRFQTDKQTNRQVAKQTGSCQAGWNADST
jgi:hypothetical protein